MFVDNLSDQTIKDGILYLREALDVCFSQALDDGQERVAKNVQLMENVLVADQEGESAGQMNRRSSSHTLHTMGHHLRQRNNALNQFYYYNTIYSGAKRSGVHLLYLLQNALLAIII